MEQYKPFEISYQITGKMQHDESFIYEIDMYNHWVIWVYGEDVDFCEFYHFGQPYTPEWMQ